MMDVLTVGRADEEMEAWVAEVVFTGVGGGEGDEHS